MAARKAKSGKHLLSAVSEVCLRLPETEEILSHGSPNFRIVKGKIFAMLTINHHGDGRVALWLASKSATQDLLIRAEPKHFFVPPYMGPRGWLGVRLDNGLSWRRIAALVQDAYRVVATARLVSKLGKPAAIEPPRIGLTLAELDPMHAPRAVHLEKALDGICLQFPQANKSTQFGFPVWCAGKKTFVQFYHDKGRYLASFWVGRDRQPMMTLDPRFHVPAYAGHNGWIALTLPAGKLNAREIHALAESSYRHFALRKMLVELDHSMP